MPETGSSHSFEDKLKSGLIFVSHQVGESTELKSREENRLERLEAIIQPAYVLRLFMTDKEESYWPVRGPKQ